MAKRVVITGSSGYVGKDVIKHFVEKGYDVLGVDIVKPASQYAKHLTADLTSLGECYSMLEGADAVIHLAAVPSMYLKPNEVTFQTNVVITYNVLEAAVGRGIKKAVIASSECAYGIPFSKTGLKPVYVPVDEEHPTLPEDAYGLSKICNEQTAAAFNRRSGIQIVAFRIGHVTDHEKYKQFPAWIHETKIRKEDLWSYIDTRDIAEACRLAIEKDGLGYIALNLSADDTSQDIKSSELMKAEYPDVTDIRSPIDEYQTLYSNKKAKEVLGWQPIHKWRDNVSL